MFGLKQVVVPNRNFKTMLEESRGISLRLQEFFRQSGYKIIDRHEDESSRSLGIDFEIYDPKRWVFRIEVKTDNRIHETGNLFIEHKMERLLGTSKGWLHYCMADLVCYHDSVQDIGYLIDWRKMREEASGFPLVRFDNWYDGCIGYGYLVPVEEAKERELIVFTYDLKGIEVPSK